MLFLFFTSSMGCFDGVQDLCSFLAMFAPIPLGTFDLTYGGTHGSCLACLLFGLKPSGWEKLL